MQAAANFRLLDKLSPGLAERTLRNPAFARAFCTGLETGKPVRLVDENVTMLISLQVMYSSRFVYCEADQFSLVEQMIQANPKYKEGLRLAIRRWYFAWRRLLMPASRRVSSGVVVCSS